MNAQRRELSLQAKAKAARFIDRVDRSRRVLAPQLGCPVEEGFFAETLRRLGVGSACLHHHHVKRLMHIDSKLDRAWARIKLRAGFLA